MGKREEERCPEVMLVPCPYQGHVTPMLQLGLALHSRGFPITVVHTRFNFPKASACDTRFSFICIEDSLSDGEITSGDFVAVILKLNDTCKKTFGDTLKERGNTSFLICDVLMYFAADVAKAAGVPAALFRTNAAANSSLYYEYSWLEEQGYLPLLESKALELVPGLHPLRFKDLPVYKFYDWKRMLEILNNARQKRSAKAILVNTVECLEQSGLAKIRAQYDIPVFSVGPLHKMVPTLSSSLLQEDDSCIAWLGKRTKSSVLYVSIGSVASMDKKDLIEMAWGLADSKQAFLWVIRPGSVLGSEWTEFLPEGFHGIVGDRGRITKWVPQKEVLEHEAVRGFWSHCGWNSSLESIVAGVPMICTPFFADQRVNTRYLSHVWKVGIVLEDMERAEIQNVVQKVMVGEEGDVIRKNVMELKDQVIRSTKESGSSYNSLEEISNLIDGWPIMRNPAGAELDENVINGGGT